MEKFAENLHLFWNKAKKTLKKGTRWFLEYYKITIPVCFCLVVLLIVGIVLGTKNKKTEVVVMNNPAATTEALPEVFEVPEMDLAENTQEDITNFVNSYYQALAEGTMETVLSMRSYTDDTEKIKIQKKSQYIENYQNIICYTKPGPVADSIIAYVYYEVKFAGINRLAPGLNSLYLYKDETGSYKIETGEMEENIAEYLKKASAQDNVVDLFNQVQVKYNEAVEADKNLSDFLLELPTRLKTEVGEELAAAVAPASTEAQPSTETAATEPVAEEAAPASEETQPQMVKVETVKTKTTVNVRSSDSETADKLGKAQEGSTYKRLEERANGWSKIEYEGKDAYVKTEFLELVDSTMVEATSNDSASTADAEQSDIGKPKSGNIIIKETVNIRKSASETGEKVGVAYKGDQYELVMKQADGWTKIKYKGQTAYVKSEFIE